MQDTVDSASDLRTVNNTVRHAYRVLSDDEKRLVLEIKDMGAAFIAKIMEMDGIVEGMIIAKGANLRDRDLEMARCHIEDAVMRTVRHITG